MKQQYKKFENAIINVVIQEIMNKKPTGAQAIWRESLIVCDAQPDKLLVQFSPAFSLQFDVHRLEQLTPDYWLGTECKLFWK